MSLTWMSPKLHDRHLYCCKKKKKKGIISADTHSPNLGISHFFIWFLFGKKDIKKPRPGWRGPKDTNFHCKISYTVGLTIVTRLHVTSSWKWKSLCHVWLFVTPMDYTVHGIPTCNARDPSLIPGLGRSPGEGKGYPLQYSGLENSMNSIVDWVAKSWTRLSNFHFHEGVISSLVTTVNPTVLNTWKVIRE